MHPKLFISHATEDKQRFVLRFAEALRGRGVDAWIDKWEMKPGDSLVQKIEEGIDEAQAFVVVLSHISVTKPWVRHELDIGVVRLIQAKTRLIPVVIDDCEIPTTLQPLLQIRVRDLNAIESAVDDVVATLTGGCEMPPLGTLPGYTAFTDFVLPELTRIDNLVLKTACDIIMESGHYSFTGHEIWQRIEATGIPESEFTDSLEALTGRHMLKNTWRSHGPMHSSFKVELTAFDKYLARSYPNYDRVFRAVAAEAANTPDALNHDIQENLSLQRVIVDHVLFMLEKQRKLTLSKTLPDYVHVVAVSVDLRRELRE